jgi:hypothetical protein
LAERVKYLADEPRVEFLEPFTYVGVTSGGEPTGRSNGGAT